VARQRGFPHRSGTKRQTSWGIGPNAATTVLTGPVSTLWTNGVQLVGESRATVVRVRGVLLISLLGVAAADGDGFLGASGIGIVSLDAFTAGAVPDPASDLEWPGWMWHSFFNVMDRDISDPAASAGTAFQRFDIDTKAMRKMGESEVLIGVTQLLVENGAATLDFSADTRVLIKLA